MIIKNCLRRMFVFFVIVGPGTLWAQTTNTVTREHDVVVIDGKKLQAFNGVSIGELFLYAFDAQTGAFTQIPFQFDEKGLMADPDDATKIDTSYFFSDDGLLDSNDELAFMAKDLGDRDMALGPGHWLTDVISMTHPRVEITIIDSIGAAGLQKGQVITEGWVYLFRSNTLTQEFTDDYVSYTAPTGSDGADTVTGETYVMAANAKGFFSDIFLPNAPATDLLDRQKIRGKTSFFFLQTFDEENPNHFKFTSLQAIDGPVRIIREVRLRFIDLLDTILPFQYFRSFVLFGGKLDIPTNIAGIAIQEIRQSIDLSSNATGMTFTNQNNANVPIDGVVDTIDKTIKKLPEVNYAHITGNQGTIVSLFSIPATIGDTQELFYQDESGIGDPGDGDAIGDVGLIVTGTDIEGEFPLALKFIFLSPNQPSSVGAQLALFEENPLVADTTSQVFNDVVPVELASFTANVEGTSVHLVWLTESETNNFGFDVERKFADAENWKKIGFIKGNGTTTTPIRYEYLDEGLQPAVYNYRLKQIDTDGSFEYSPILTARIGTPESFALLPNFPNPFNPATTISYQIPANKVGSDEGTKTRLHIYNLLGEVVRTLVDERQAPGFYSVLWNGKDDGGRVVPTGVYIYQLESGEFLQTMKMLLVK